MADDYKYHIDHHSTLIRPADLGDEDQAIREALRMQRRLGLAALGDGQFRRRTPLAPYYDNIEGFGPESEQSSLTELLGQLAPERRQLIGPPKPKARLVENESKFLVAAIDRPILIALPSPGYVAELSEANESDASALATILHDEIEALAKDGVAYVQLHNPLAAILLTTAGRTRARDLGLDPDTILARMKTTDAQAIKALNVPETFRVGLDLTTSGTAQGYDLPATATYLADQPYQRLCVEYPTEEPARFPISLLTPGTVVSLGVVDVSTPALEDVDELVTRIDEAATIINIDDIAISTNGGRATREKLQLVEMTARYFWGNEL